MEFLTPRCLTFVTVRIVCATCNAFKPPLLQNNEGDDIAKYMIALSKLPNMLKQNVVANCWDTRVKSQWKVIDEADLSDFTELTEPNNGGVPAETSRLLYGRDTTDAGQYYNYGA